MTQYVAYTNLGAGRESGTTIDPEDFGGEDNEAFQDMLKARTIVPLGDPDAAIAMGKNPEALAANEERDKELEAARNRVKELEAQLAEARKQQASSGPKQEEPSSSGSGTGAGSSQQGSATTRPTTPGSTK
jgi:serine/threonine protein kinase HipA of HipAB toxin-antitoxin module